MSGRESVIEEAFISADSLIITGVSNVFPFDEAPHLLLFDGESIIDSGEIVEVNDVNVDKKGFSFRFKVRNFITDGLSTDNMFILSALTGEIVAKLAVSSDSEQCDIVKRLSAIANYCAPDQNSWGKTWLDGPRVRGWAIEVGTLGEKVPLQLEINGSHMVTVTNQQYSLDFAGLGFCFDIAPEFLTEDINFIQIKDSRSKKPIGDKIVVKATDRFVGYIEVVEVDGLRCRIAGWALDAAVPSLPARLDVFVRDHLVLSAVCNVTRPDVQERFKSTRSAGFNFNFHAKVEAISEVIVRFAGTTHQLLMLPVAVGEEIQKKEIVYLIEPQKIPVEELVAVTIDKIDGLNITGWSADLSDVSKSVELMLSLNGAPYALARTTTFRRDVQKAIGGDGFKGYSFELNPFLNLTEALRYRLHDSAGRSEKSKRSDGFLPPLYSNALPAPDTPPPRRSSARDVEFPPMSLIVITKNGERLLSAFLTTLLAFVEGYSLELIIVDQGSSDGSIALVSNFASANAHLISTKLIEKSEDLGFSAANNLAADCAKGDILFFLNNDIEFIQDIFAAVAATFSNPNVAVSGIRLLDKSVLKPWQSHTPTQHIGVCFDNDSQGSLFPFELRRADRSASGAYAVPAVTGAALCCRKDIFEALNGFDENFFYGHEDVDLCLRAWRDLKKEVVCLSGETAVHARGTSRRLLQKADQERLAANRVLFRRRWDFNLKRLIRQEIFTKRTFWSGRAPTVAFAVTKVSDTASAGDYFTALELGEAIRSEFGAQIVFLGRGEWYQLAGVDLVIALLDDFNPTLIENAGATLTVVAWARNWFDRWCTRDSISAFHHVWASSDRAARFMANQLGRPVEVVRLGTSASRFAKGRPDSEPNSDVVFTGSYFDAPREIIRQIEDLTYEADLHVIGHNWEKVPSITKYAKGSRKYTDMPDVYACTKIVLDDSNSATRQWGSVNSRVFDALGAGRLVLTNGEIGATEVFGDRLPIFRSSQELDRLLSTYLVDEAARLDKTRALQEEVLAHHTYAARAKQIGTIVSGDRALRFAIKIGCPRHNEREAWGDYHFAAALARALTSEGHCARVDTIDMWSSPLSRSDDVVICLRGLSKYEPKAGTLNILWMLSHPLTISTSELELYDHVFVASDYYARVLAPMTSTPVSVLLQATDPTRFYPMPPSPYLPQHELLFVGNSRGVKRPIVVDALRDNLPIAVYGGGWSNLISSNAVFGAHIPNEILGKMYANAGILLNDHWEDMRKQGFVSNRIFDAAACSVRVISDDVANLPSFFQGIVTTYSGRGGLSDALECARKVTDDQLNALSELILREHTFSQRATSILDEVEKLILEKKRLSRSYA